MGEDNVWDEEKKQKVRCGDEELTGMKYTPSVG